MHFEMEVQVKQTFSNVRKYEPHSVCDLRCLGSVLGFRLQLFLSETETDLGPVEPVYDKEFRV